MSKKAYQKVKNILENAFFVTTPPNRRKMGSKSEKMDFFPIFSIFTKGIKAKLNYLESESDTLTQNGLENQFPFSITTSALWNG